MRRTHSPEALIEALDEMAYLDGCRPARPYAVLVRVPGMPEESNGEMYCRSCCWDVRGSPVATMADCEDEPCHCAGCGRILAYTLSADGARSAARLLDDVSGLKCDDRYHLARMIEACPEENVLLMGRKMLEQHGDI